MRFFKDTDSMMSFFDRVFANDSVDKNPRKMMNQIVRWVGLAEDLRKIRPSNDPLVILCIRSCIESICKYGSAPGDKTTFFEKNLSPEGLSYFGEAFEVIDSGNKGISESATGVKPDIKNFDKLIYKIRNNAVHDGDYWSSQVFVNEESDGYALGYYVVDDDHRTTTYYESKIEYGKFISFFVNAAIRYIDDYVVNRYGENMSI